MSSGRRVHAIFAAQPRWLRLFFVFLNRRLGYTVRLVFLDTAKT
jgi:hypothetical protein